MSSTPEELTLCGSTMEPQMAIDKEVLDKSKGDKIIHKDNRNLYLIKEGGIKIIFLNLKMVFNMILLYSVLVIFKSSKLCFSYNYWYTSCQWCICS